MNILCCRLRYLYLKTVDGHIMCLDLHGLLSSHFIIYYIMIWYWCIAKVALRVGLETHRKKLYSQPNNLPFLESFDVFTLLFGDYYFVYKSSKGTFHPCKLFLRCAWFSCSQIKVLCSCTVPVNLPCHSHGMTKEGDFNWLGVFLHSLVMHGISKRSQCLCLCIKHW